MDIILTRESREQFTLYCGRTTGVVLLRVSLVTVIASYSRLAVCPAVPLKPVDGLSAFLFRCLLCQLSDYDVWCEWSMAPWF